MKEVTEVLNLDGSRVKEKGWFCLTIGPACEERTRQGRNETLSPDNNLQSTVYYYIRILISLLVSHNECTCDKRGVDPHLTIQNNPSTRCKLLYTRNPFRPVRFRPGPGVRARIPNSPSKVNQPAPPPRLFDTTSSPPHHHGAHPPRSFSIIPSFTSYPTTPSSIYPFFYDRHAHNAFGPRLALCSHDYLCC